MQASRRPGLVPLTATVLFAVGTGPSRAEDRLVPAVSDSDYSGCAGTVAARTLSADPGNYLGLVAGLQAGDRLVLAPGTYAGGLTLWGRNGAPANCIVIEGPASGPPAVFTGRDCCNTVSLQDSSYLVIRNLELDGQGRAGDGVKAEGTAQSVHHVTLENLLIRGHGADQQIVGINTKCPAWNWVIRRNVIEGAGTGIYLGNSDGEDEFAHGLVEFNLVRDTLGYNMQVKHQNGRATGLGSPASGRTIIRHNVFSKALNAAGGGNARPNLLVGHWPLAGPGSTDIYEIYGNFFHENPTEALFQGEGNVAFYANLLVNGAGGAVNVQPHMNLPRLIRIFQNTVVATGTGIRVSGGDPAYTQRVVGNAVFAGTPLSGGTQVDNATGSYAAAGGSLTNPFGVVTGTTNRLDLFPLPGGLLGGPIDSSGLNVHDDFDRDFGGDAFGGTRRGAYAGEGTNPGWRLGLERKIDWVFRDGFEGG
jgi:hypothetical protein